jgi:1-hydroxycarotenoid 3,4-desaturase
MFVRLRAAARSRGAWHGRTHRLTRTRVVVVGAGIGGLVCGVAAGRAAGVTCHAGGGGRRARAARCAPLAVDGASIDAGPTVMTMRWVFDEMLADAGAVARRPA